MKQLKELCLLPTGPIHRAAAKNNLSGMQEYVKGGSTSINAFDNNGLSALHYAVLHGNLDVIEMLLSSGAHVNDLSVRNDRNVIPQGLAPLHLAAHTGDENAFKALLLNGADINLADSDGKRAIHYACEAKQMSIVEIILKNSGKIDVVDNSGYTPLCYALTTDKCFLTGTKLVKKLVEAEGKADVNLIGETAEFTPLHLACESPEPDLVELLCDNGAYVNAFKNDTALHVAAAKSSGKTVVALLVRKANPNQQDKKGETPLHKVSARRDEQSVGIIKSLLKNGANVEVHNQHNKLPLDIAVENGNTENIEALVKFTKTSKLSAKNFKAMLEKYPEYTEELFTNSIVTSSETEDHSENNYDLFGFDFRLLNTEINPGKQHSNTCNETIKAVAESKELRLINHPLFQIFMRYKWTTTRYAFYMNLLVYLMFLALLTTALLSSRVSVVSSLFKHERQNDSTYARKPLADELYNAVWWRILCQVLMVVNACHLSKEFMELITLRFEYFQSTENYLDCAIHVLTISLTSGLTGGHITETQWSAGDIALLLAWIKLMYFLRYFDIFNAYLYVLMFFKVTQIFCSFMLIFIIPTIAFSLSFHCILWRTPAFDTPLDSFFKTIAMTSGEITFDEIITINEHQSIVAKLIMAIFQVLSPILLMNLLIGLAVGDIDDLRSKAQVKRCQNEVDVIADIENEIRLQEMIILMFKYLLTCQLRNLKTLFIQRRLKKIRHCSQAHQKVDKIFHKILRFHLRVQSVFGGRAVPPHKNPHRRSAVRFSIKGECPHEQKTKEMFSEEVNLTGICHKVFTYWELDAIGGGSGRLAYEVRRRVNEKEALIKQLNNDSTCHLLQTKHHMETKMKELMTQQMEICLTKFKQELQEEEKSNGNNERLTTVETKLNELCNLQKNILDRLTVR